MPQTWRSDAASSSISDLGSRCHLSDIDRELLWPGIDITASGTDVSSVLDGLTISAGWAQGSASNADGPAVFCNGANPTLNHLNVIGNRAADRAALAGCSSTISSSAFVNNRGDLVGAIANTPATYIDTSFIGNSSGGQASVFYLAGGDLVLRNCEFRDNSTSASTNRPGVVRAQGTNIDFDNVLFSGNHSGGGAAVHLNSSGGGTMTNVTFTGNLATSGGAALRFDASGSLTITNSIFWANQEASNFGTLGASITDLNNGSISISNSILQGSGGSGAGWLGGTIVDGGGNLNQSLTMPAGSAVTYTATCFISPSKTGTLSNTATISSVVYDPFTANNSATDDDTVVTQAADLSITKDNAVDLLSPGDTVTDTITASNPGPSDIVAAEVSDIIPAELISCFWSCTSFEASCNPAPIDDLSDLPDFFIGGNVTYTGVCTVGASSTFTAVANTVTISVPAGASDPSPRNNSATDVDLGPLIFWDDFESGDANLWSTAVQALATPGGGP